MIRAYVAPTDQPTIWVEVPAGRVVIDGDTAIIEITHNDESPELREQMHHAEATIELTCDIGECVGHVVNSEQGVCIHHGGRP